MCRCVALVFLCVLLTVVAADRDHDAEGGYGLRYGQRPREGRREAESQRFTPSQEVQEVGGIQEENPSEADSNPRYRHRQRANKHEQENTSEDSGSDGSSYRTVVLHDTQGPQRANVHHQTLRKKPTKPRQKARQAQRENYPYKSPKNSKPADPPPNIVPSTTSSPDQFVHAVHPSIMQNLLKQQPQTFDVPQEKETDQYEQGQNNWQAQSGSQPSDGEGLKSYHTDFRSQGVVVGQQESHDVSKRPIYVPNRVSVQSPSSDTSFNVGYSIGFGSGVAQPPRLGIVQPPINVRQGKQLSLPISYQNVPVNVHIDGKNSVWKNMGSGVEMSHNVDSKYESPNPGDTGERHVYSSGSVINQPIYYREGFDQNFNSISTSGRNNFDHNHALQQSNPFDFSNAIDPLTRNPYSETEQKSNQFPSYVHPSFTDSFPKQPAPTFTESSAKHSNSKAKSTLVRNQPHYETANEETTQYTRDALPQNDHYESTQEKYEKPNFEKPSFLTNSHGPVRTPNSITPNTKQKYSDFLKANPSVAKSSYQFKTFANNGLNSIKDETFGNSFGFQNPPVLPPLYGSPGKVHPPGMVQAILVPVNSPPPPMSFPVGMPVIGNGYSPYFGHPVGMVRLPAPVGVSLPPKEEYESSAYNVNSQLENKQPDNGSPMNIVQTHYTTIHHKDEAQNHQHHLNRPSSHPRLAEVPERSPKFNNVFSTEAPADRPSSPFKSYSPSLYTPTFESSSFREHSSFKGHSTPYTSFKEPSPSYSSLKETSLPHHTTITHHPRLYRPKAKKLVIVKRS